ncbi:TonB-dependent receptor [Sulfidibacter corallicola]|uniref:TonB-dependent receptor n=1 Tax=Sulfidibacter corallicola TaxID=2818388 RepID=A0A8A4TL92_SULCO|nr:TonB-dependent receptor [Sulfidibacter corallicola]QTD50247.1 TonB-dependent receptor [Sulfidibacter corallicola]
MLHVLVSNPFSLSMMLLFTSFSDDQERMDRLAQLSIEELISIKVVSADKAPRVLSDSAAAVFVVTREDMVRSGAISLADALRLVPGVQVARIGVDVWAISVRGFNELHADKLLVLIDGRTIYNHLFSGVFWPRFDLPVEDVARIEVIRGPGSTLWGANAVNGVINIITRHASETHGPFLSLAGGNIERGLGIFRYGGALGERTDYRVSALSQFREQKAVAFDPRVRSDDEVEDFHLSFRVDHRFENESSLMVSGEKFNSHGRRPTAPAPLQIDDRAAYLQARWQSDPGADVGHSVQVYIDYFKREREFDWVVYDLEYQQDRQVGNHDLVWGFGYRHIEDDVVRGLAGGFEFAPQKTDEAVSNLFIQDRWTLREGRLFLQWGAKIEHNEFTHEELQPSARLLWKLPGNRERNLWFAASRAVHVPSRLERDGGLMGRIVGPPSPTVEGNPQLDSSDLIAAEIGYRTLLTTGFWLDASTFYHDYDGLVDYERDRGRFRRVNAMKGHSSGVELALEWHHGKWWRLAGSLNYLNMEMELEDWDLPLRDLVDFVENGSPEIQATLRSYMNFGRAWQLDITGRYVDSVVHAALANPVAPPPLSIDAYTTFDMHVGYRPSRRFELSLVGRDLAGENREITLYEHEPSGSVELKIWF